MHLGWKIKITQHLENNQFLAILMRLYALNDIFFTKQCKCANHRWKNNATVAQNVAKCLYSCAHDSEIDGCLYSLLSDTLKFTSTGCSTNERLKPRLNNTSLVPVHIQSVRQTMAKHQKPQELKI